MKTRKRFCTFAENPAIITVFILKKHFLGKRHDPGAKKSGAVTLSLIKQFKYHITFKRIYLVYLNIIA